MRVSPWFMVVKEEFELCGNGSNFSLLHGLLHGLLKARSPNLGTPRLRACTQVLTTYARSLHPYSTRVQGYPAGGFRL